MVYFYSSNFSTIFYNNYSWKTIHLGTLLWKHFAIENSHFAVIMAIFCDNVKIAILTVNSFRSWDSNSVLSRTRAPAQIYIFLTIPLCRFALFLSSPFNQRAFAKRGKYHCTADLLFDWFGFDQTCKIVLHST